MSDASERLRDAALRPLAEQPQARLAAAEMLDRMAPPSHPGADAMIARWDALDARKRRPLWRWVLGVALVAVSAWVLVGVTHEALRSQRLILRFANPGSGRLGEMNQLKGAGLSERDLFLLFGDISKSSPAQQMKALWDSEPDNPTCYAAYAVKYRGEHGVYPPDFLETARRLDPGNAWFIYHAAADLAQNCVKKDRQTTQARKAGEAPSWKILDEPKLNQALALLREATGQKQFVSRAKLFVAARLPLLPQDDQVSRAVADGYLSDYCTADFAMRYVGDAIAAKAWLLGGAGDASGFKQLLGDADAYMKVAVGMENPTVIEGLLVRENARILYVNLHAAAEKLGLAEDASRLKRIKERLVQASADQKLRFETQGNDGIEKRCGVLSRSASVTRMQVASPPPLTDADLKPGRRVEHLLGARVCSLAVWVLLGVGVLAVVVFRFCLPAWMLRLAQRINALWLPVDWAWLLGAGVLLPFAVVTALMRLTPLGGQDWGLVAGGAAILVAADFLAMALLLLVVPVLVARWRLFRRAAALGICSGGSRLGWLAVVAGLLMVPVLGMAPPPGAGPDHPLVVAALVLLVPLVLLILNSLVRALAGKFTRQFSRAVVALTLIPAYACGMLLLMVSMPIYKSVQTCWERRDSMTELTSNGSNRYETAVARQLLAEVREMLE